MADARSARPRTARGGRTQSTDGKPVGQGERWAQRRDEIVDVAAGLFAKQGYNATGISELCDAVSLGKGSLYYYIGSKEQILARIHGRVMDHVLQSASDVESLEAAPAEKLRLLGIELISVITQYPDHVWVFLHEWPALHGERAKEFKRQRRCYEEAIERVLADGVAAGDFMIDDLRLAVHAWLGMHNYTYQWFRPGGRLNAFQIANHYHRVFLSGVTRPTEGNTKSGKRAAG